MLQRPKTVSTLDAIPMISLEDVYAHLRLTPEDDSPPYHIDDALLRAQMSAAREWVEGYTGCALTPRTLELALDRFPSGAVELPVPPTVGVTSVTYTDGDGATQLMDQNAYYLDNYQRPGWLLPAVGTSWPTTYAVANAVKIRYTVGYSLRTDNPQTNPLPASLRAAVLLVLGSLYENREQSVERALTLLPLGVHSLCDFYRVRKALA